ncbi:cytochrome c oxidase subunit II [Phenylobacterium sp.]|uniref:cytochrome c oxidase subunit II n=1 Tax=Phenylobacterium sp. TaxID=1871053 RepID=UPI002E372391|nr:cytochrome c oxidase subunit II [Phenylobacterium sp.]HEX2560990.1 cytochrome c oxidase subunit II [Phenylobacterium sp.]
MKSRFQGIRTLAAGAAASVAMATFAGAAFAEDLLGQPTPGGIGLQPAASPLKHQAHFFHDAVLMPIITAICLLVLGLLIWVIVRFNKRANPTPARWSHNTPVEIVWTVLPVMILMFIAIFSFRLLFAYHDMPRADVTVKATGYQWYWGYEYPDHGISEYISNMLPEEDAKARGVPYRLAVTEPIVVPEGKVVRVLTTGADVIHAFAIPAFGIIADSVPGRVNETWFKADRVGTYYGNCRELCGVDHAFMPIEVKVVTQAEFDAWVATKSGKAPAPTATTLDAQADAASAAAAAPAAGAAAPAGAPAPAASTPAAPAAAAPAAPVAPAAK